MKVSDLGPLARMLQRTPSSRVWRRAELSLKRRARVALERVWPGQLRPQVNARATDPSRWPQPTLPALTNDPRTDAEFRADAVAWIEENPPYQADYWRGQWSADAVAQRAVTWMGQLAVRSLDRPEALYESLTGQLAYLARNLQTDVGGPSLLRAILALRWGAACFDGGDADGWAALADQTLAACIGHEIPQDGLHVQRSASVHLEVFATLLTLHDLLPEGPLQRDLAQALQRMAYAASFTTAPDGQPLLLGDSRLNPPRSAAALLDAWLAAGGTVDSVPAAAALADAGWYAWRTNDDLVVVDAGPLGDPARPAAGHADALALTWVLQGQRFLVDQGAPGPASKDRAPARQTRCHNTLTLDDSDQAELFGETRAGRRWTVTRHAWMPRADGFVLTASHDGYSHLPGQPVHRRTVEVKGRKIRVEDRVEGGDGQRAVCRLLLHPDVDVRVLGSGAILKRGELQIDLRTSAAVRVVDAVWWPEPGVERPTRRLELDLGLAPCSARFTLQVTADAG